MAAERQVILCVDDEAIVLESLDLELGGRFPGVQLELLDDPLEAENLVGELLADGWEIPVVICDYIMPGLRGDELLSRVHQDSPGTRTIMLTGQNSTEGIVNAINRAGLFRFIAKPWNAHDLRLTVGTALESFRQAARIRWQNAELLELNRHLERKVTERTAELEASRDSLNRAQSIARIGSLEWDAGSGATVWSDELYRILGQEPGAEPPSMALYLARCHHDDRPKVADALSSSAQASPGLVLEHRLALPDRTLRHVQVQGEFEFGADSRLRATVQDVTLMRTTQDKLLKYLHLFDEHVISFTFDHGGTITQASQALCEKSGYSRRELVGMDCRELLAGDNASELPSAMDHTAACGGIWQGEVRYRRKDGEIYWVREVQSPNIDEHGDVVSFTAIQEDVTDRKRVERLSVTDELTGLYNRRFFNRAFGQEIARARRGGLLLALFMIDVDHFKAYNDRYGHHAGDQALVGVAAVILAHFRRAGDCAFRLGGEEFCVLSTVRTRDEARNIGEHLVRAMEDTGMEHAASGASRFLTVSVGIALAGTDGESAPELLYQAADRALYLAKSQGRNRVCLGAPA